MACNIFTIVPITSPGPNTNGLFRSKSSKDLRDIHAPMQRSHSENHLIKNSAGRVFSASNKYSFLTNNSLRTSFLFDARDMSIVEKETSSVVDHDHDHDDGDNEEAIKKRANWVERIMELRTRWRSRSREDEEDQKDVGDIGETDDIDDKEVVSDCDCDGCEVSYDDDDGEEKGRAEFDRESFSRFLVRVAWSDVKLFSQLAFLCNIAYVIPDIKAKDLRRRFGLKFVTSSLERKSEAEKIKEKVVVEEEEEDTSQVTSSGTQSKKQIIKSENKTSRAYGIAASAASYVKSEAGSEVAACVAASTMTAVVAAGERERSEAAMDLRSLHSSPCEWFVCDDPTTYTRCFVIQGSDSLSSWQANLFFEPTKFEETECLAHRGIYEAAKGMYTQLMPEIIEHLSNHGERAKLRFTGHSLGGSLSLLLHLMLLMRKVVKPSALLPVVTFGSPFVLCGGHKILEELGVDDTQINCVIMHRDIVPRAFSCNYPDHAANLLKRLNGTFRSHPCLIRNKFLYSPMGKVLVLQPEEKWSPPHPLLPQGCSLYAVENVDQSNERYSYSSVLRAFLNNPHPLETLSDPTAYGSDGTILRDHDSSNYLKGVNAVLKRNYNTNNNNYYISKNNNNNNNVLWPLLSDSNNWVMIKEIMTGV